MNGRRRVLRAAEYIVGWASAYLPSGTREQRQQEWMAELPAILDDPAVRPAARRVTRMLWFAADTLRGAAVARYTAAGRHAHRDADGKARDLLTRRGLTGLAAVPVLLTLTGYVIFAGHGLTRDLAQLLIPLIILFATLAAREPVGLRSLWYVWSMLPFATGQLLHDLAHHLGWGHRVLFEIIYFGSAVSLFVPIVVFGAGWVRSRRDRFRQVRP